MSGINEIIQKAHELGASDVHIVCSLPVKVRVDGKIVNLSDEIICEDDCERLAREIAGEKIEECAKIGEIDLAKTFDGPIRTRINLFRQQGHISAAIRLLNDRIPEIEELGLPEIVETFPAIRSGIVLVTGETGSGKSTTLAAILNRINHTRAGHIITLEDPIEYVYTPDKCVINQREIGTDTASYADGLKSILREDPDVILIGEMRDLNTISAALTAAETGHLVFATLHTNSAADSIDRIVNVFPDGEQKQIRLQVSTCLKAVLSQQLLPRREGTGRVAACEVMVVNSAVANLIREGKTPQLKGSMELYEKDGSISMDKAILKLVNDMAIDRDTAALYATDKELFARRK